MEMHATECLELYDTFMAVAHRAIRLIAKGLNLEVCGSGNYDKVQLSSPSPVFSSLILI